MATKRKKASETLYCSFCGNSQYEVRKLIAGTGEITAKICDSCVQFAVDVLTDTDLEDASTDAASLARYVAQQTEIITEASTRISRATRALRDKQPPDPGQ